MFGRSFCLKSEDGFHLVRQPQEKTGISEYLGEKGTRKWRAQISSLTGRVFLGTYRSEQEAYMIYRRGRFILESFGWVMLDKRVFEELLFGKTLD